MVAMTEEQRRKWWADLQEDYEDFKIFHREETKRRWEFVDARLIGLPGPRLAELERMNLIAGDGAYRYRPLK